MEPTFLLVRTATALPHTLQKFTKNGLKVRGLAISKTLPCSLTTANFKGADGLILTSAVAVACVPAGVKIPFYCVGAATAKKAKAKGFKVAYVGKSGAQGLLNHCPMGVYVHVCADVAAVLTLASKISTPRTKLKIRRVVGYKTTYTQKLPPDVAAHIRDMVVVLYSVNGAKTFVKLLSHHGLDCAMLTAVCISPAVAVAARAFGTVYTASSPVGVMEICRKIKT